MEKSCPCFLTRCKRRRQLYFYFRALLCFSALCGQRGNSFTFSKSKFDLQTKHHGHCTKKRLRTSRTDRIEWEAENKNSGDKSPQTGFNKAWNAGDVYEDLDRLERAIVMSNAEQDLQHKERIEVLNHFSRQRRPIAQDLRKFVMLPLALSLLATASAKTFSSLRPLNKLAFFALDLHFWILIVVAPLSLLSLKRRKSSPSTDLSPGLIGVDPEYIRFLSAKEWEDPRKSCQDYVLCLLEQWASAVVGVGLLGSFLPATGRRVAQFLTRLAVVASLLQYPKLWFNLNNEKQARPIPGFVWITRAVTRLQIVPWTLALEFSRLMAPLRFSTVCYIFGCIASIIGISIAQVVFTEQHPKRDRKLPLKVFFTIGLALLGWRHGESILSILHFLRPRPAKELPIMLLNLVGQNKRNILQAFVFGFVSIGPLCHLFAFRKLFHVNYMHDLSLAIKPEELRRKLNDPLEYKNRFRWRYRLRWREPKRILTTLEEWRRGFGHWLFYAGSVEDQLRRKLRSNRDSEAKRQGLTVWQRIKEEKEKNPEMMMEDRTMWKQNAMDLLAQKHQRDFDRGTYEDPLGVAIHQTFGIGLGYTFDHMSKLDENETPSTRRLQARAAKSAIRRAQAIYNDSAARSILNEIKDPKERQLKASQMRHDAEEEIRSLALRLTELIPTDLSLDDGENTEIQQFTSNKFVQTSPNEYVIVSPAEEKSPVVNNLLGKQQDSDNEIDYLNPSGKNKSSESTTTQDDSVSSDNNVDKEENDENNDNEFVEEWLRRANYEGENDDDDDFKTFLA